MPTPPVSLSGFTGVNTAKKSFFSSTYPLHKAAEMGNAKIASHPVLPVACQYACRNARLNEETGEIAVGAGCQPVCEELRGQDCSAGIGQLFSAEHLVKETCRLFRWKVVMQKKKGESHKEAGKHMRR